jgi:sulfate adenylyltransferase subunit 1 (EFTu-like GTPase family)
MTDEQRIREQGATIAAFKAEVEMWRDEAQLQTANTKYWRERAEAAEAEIERLRKALNIIAGNEQCADNLMSNSDVARAALKGGEHGDTERIRAAKDGG